LTGATIMSETLLTTVLGDVSALWKELGREREEEEDAESADQFDFQMMIAREMLESDLGLKRI
jgi:hypothetical protein